MAEQADFEDDDHKELYSQKFRMKFNATLLLEREEIIEKLKVVKQYKVVKRGRFLQALFYLLGYKKEQVCEPGTQKFFWKVAKKMLNDDFINKMLAFEIMGPKEGPYEKYQTLNYIEKIIAGIEQAHVDEFNHTIGRLFKWLKLAVDNRKSDIIRRRALITKARDERDAKI